MAAGTAGHEDHDEAAVLSAERAVNERYPRELERMVKGAPHLAGSVGAPRSSTWTDSAPNTRVSHAVVSPIVGRVGLVDDDPDLGRGFYIGGLWGRDWPAADREIFVVAWAAPVAKLFFDGRDAADPSAKLVGGRRTFMATTDGDVRSYEDDLEDDVASGASVFPLPNQGSVVVPAPPKPIERPVRTRTRRGPTSPPPRRDQGSTTSQAPMPTPVTPPPTGAPSAAGHATSPPAPRSPHTPAEPAKLRAAGAVMTAVQAPRTGRLGSVLATLQPDQYEIVTWPADEPLIVQGQPGTGKTIVATHRAAYLVHREREPRPLSHVAIVGPTEAWRHHVSPSLGQLSAAGVSAISLEELLGELSGVPWHRAGAGPDDRADTTWALGRFLEDAVAALKTAPGREVKSVRDAVDLIGDRSVVELTPVRTRHRAEADWFGRSGGWTRLSSQTRFLPALAAIGLALGRSSNRPVDHLIVDEAQDVRPLEWKILLDLLRVDGAVTLLGDVNQRRCDWTAASWDALAVDLAISDDEGRAPIRHVATGYRTTRRILRFANQLLPRGERSVDAVREGVDPAVERVRATELDLRAVDVARSLAAKHQPGIVGVITMTPRPISDRFRRLGWSRPADRRDAWQSEGSTVVILHPDRARGLEFDGVVVVEPASFPENIGRAGRLYTSLTRATKELNVLHSMALPRGLRAPRSK